MFETADDTPTPLALEFADFRTFLQAFSPNVSLSGMFVESLDPPSPGTEIDFEVALENGDPLIRGRGVVAWVSDNGGSEAAGVGVRFVDLHEDSASLVERIVETRTNGGRKIFDLEQKTPPEASKPAGEDATPDLAHAQIESLNQAQTEERARWQAELTAVTEVRDKLADRVRELQETWLEERARIEGEKQALFEELEAFRAQAAEYEKRIQEQETVLARFAEQGKYAMAERDKLEAGKKALAEQLEEARANLERVEAESAALRESASELAAARAEIARLETEHEKLRDSASKLAEVESSLAEAQTVEEALREQLDEARSTAERVEVDASTTEAQLRSELEELEKDKAELRERLGQGQSELDDVRRRFEESGERNLELEHETSSLGSRLSEAREQIASLESETGAIRAEMETLRKERDNFETRFAAQKKVAKRAKKVSERVRAEHVKLQQDFAEVQATLEEMQEDAQRLEEVHEDTQRAEAGLDELSREIDAAGGELGGGHPAADGPANPERSIWSTISRPLGRLLGDDQKTGADETVTAERDASQSLVEESALATDGASGERDERP